MDGNLTKGPILKTLTKLALPIMASSFLGTLYNITDMAWIGLLGSKAVAGVGVGGMFTWLSQGLASMARMGGQVKVAQSLGRGEKEKAHGFAQTAVQLSTFMGLAYAILCLIFVRQMVGFFKLNDPEAVSAALSYTKIACGLIVFSFLTVTLTGIYTAQGDSKTPFLANLVGLVTNMILDPVLILGPGPFPKLGVTGVALGTVIARITEVVICLIYSLKSSDVRFRIKYFFAKSGILFQDFMKIATPAVINDVVWSFASSAFAAILGHIGNDMVAANAVAVMVVNIGAIACRGFANATTIIVSQELGQNHIDTAREYGKRMLRITTIVSMVGCVIILAIRPLILDFYRDKLTETAIYYLGIFIIMTTWRLLGEGINTCLICGCFRGGGDSRFGMIIDSVFMWLVAVPLTFLAAYVLKLPPIWVYFIMTLDEFEKMPAVFIHYFRGKWLTNITRDFE